MRSTLFLATILLSGCTRTNAPAARGAPEPNTTNDPAQTLVSRLDFQRYKNAIKGFTAFGDRLQGTQRNLDALDWVEAQLKSYGYTNVERHDFQHQGQPRQSIYATKIGSTVPQEMYFVSAHIDGRGGGEAADDDGSGSAIVLELARLMGSADVRTERSIRFAFWNVEEGGEIGSQAYVRDRAPLQGMENPPGSGRYPEPKWMGILQHDMMMFDHGLPPGAEQSPAADVDIEYQANSAKAAESAALAALVLAANKSFASDYPAEVGTNMMHTDSRAFQNHTAAVSLRENQRIAEIGRRTNPHWHQATDLFATYSDKDFRLGFNAAQTTLGAVARLAGLTIAR